ncbi:MAG TPA: J domain-containing protein, partial [Stellaceae bacterium]|nr:J domain-containing protein [Stellaceae bacterium]
RGEIDASGAERPEHAYRRYAEGAQGAKYQQGSGFSEEDLGDIFADLFGRGARAGAGGFGGGPGGGFGGGPGGGQTIRLRGADRAFTLTIDFLEAARGAKKRLTFAPGHSLDVTIPAGFAEGQILRLKGQGDPGIGGGPPGDALIEIHVTPHPLFRREGNDIHLELPVTVAEAVLGAKIAVPTIGGTLNVTVPKGSDSGTVLRLKGRGIEPATGTAGDQYVTLKIVLGAQKNDGELAAFLAEWAPRHPFDPRPGMSGS